MCNCFLFPGSRHFLTRADSGVLHGTRLSQSSRCGYRAKQSCSSIACQPQLQPGREQIPSAQFQEPARATNQNSLATLHFQETQTTLWRSASSNRSLRPDVTITRLQHVSCPFEKSPAKMLVNCKQMRSAMEKGKMTKKLEGPQKRRFTGQKEPARSASAS